MKKPLFISILSIFLSCSQNSIEKHCKHYRNHNDIESLRKAVELISIGTDTSSIRELLGEPIDFGFDYRYTTNTIGENGCPVGAVFGIDSLGKISSKSILEICE